MIKIIHVVCVCVLTYLWFVSGTVVKADPIQRQFYVSPDGADSNPGTLTEPYATVQRAKQAVRQAKGGSLDRNVVVWLREGTYLLPNGLTFGPEDGGTEDHSVTYAAYQDEVPVLLGGVRLDQWVKHEGHIYRSVLPRNVQSTQLFEGDQRMTLARSPNEGYFGLEQEAHVSGYFGFTYSSEDVEPSAWSWRDGMVNIWPRRNWFNFNWPIRDIKTAQDTIVLDTNSRDLERNNRYYVFNIPELLDQPGECCILASRKLVLAWPTAGEQGPEEMILSTAENLIQVRGRADGLVRNLHFAGLDVGICEACAFHISFAENCSIRNCKIENAGITGVLIRDHAQEIEVYGNLIRWHGQHGVSLQGPWMGQPDVHHHHRVENNHIHHCGRLIGHGYGVRIYQSGDNQVLHNDIHHLPRYGTTIKGNKYGNIAGKIPGMTWENRYDFMHGRNNLIAYNHIHHTNLDSQDTGAMESWGPGRDNQYDHNLIHDTGNDQFNLQSGIYLDDQSDYFTVTNNIIYGVVGTSNNQCVYAKGIGNHIENNILIGSSHCLIGISSFYMGGERCDHHTYLRNIMYFDSSNMMSTGGAFGSNVWNLHPRGTTLTWRIASPASERYQVWIRYASYNEPYGTPSMDGRLRLRVQGGDRMTPRNLPDTGAWGRFDWAHVGNLRFDEGVQLLVFENVEGGGINLDALVFCTDSTWEPEGVDLAPAADGHHLLVVHAETYVSRDGRRREAAAYWFVNWSDDRVYASDYNVFYHDQAGITIHGSPADGSLEEWRAILSQRYDQHSVVANPLFVNPAAHDYDLRAASPALDLGFVSIDTSEIGLRPDFPERFTTPQPPVPGPETPSTEGFETGDFSAFDWRLSGDSDWFVTPGGTGGGQFCAQAGDIDDHEESYLEVLVGCSDGEVTFYYKISSESGYDSLTFTIDGDEQDEWSGEQDWTQVSVPVEAGTRLFTWTYGKDGSMSEGEDTAWLDDIVFPVR